MKVFLCHKCCGLLIGKVVGAFRCLCISGYVRDWQKPTVLQDVLPQQLTALKARRALLGQQGACNEVLAIADAAIARMAGLIEKE